jgi:hypothetical protein
LYASILRRRTLGAGALLLAALTLTLAFGAPGRASAQSPPDSGCDPSEQVACIPIPEQGTGGPAPTIGTPIPPVPGPCHPVSVQAGAPGVAIGTPIPPGCPVQDVVATMNRANVLWARALRTTDASELPQVWGGDALNSIRSYISSLRSAGQYATPELQAITLTGVQSDGRRAYVTTTERWLMQLRFRLSGQVLYEEIQNVQNLYGLEWNGNRWIVTRNDVWPAGGSVPPFPPLPVPPVPVPPVPPPGPPCIAIFPPPPGCDLPAPKLVVSTDRDVYQRGETIFVAVTNTGTETLSGGGGYRCEFVDVIIATGVDSYAPAPGGADICPAIALLLKPGETRTEAITLTQPGRYRMVVEATAEGSGEKVVASSGEISVQ